ncbi:spexin prohormone 1-like [Poeciliopsis prolifica]|uniref:spexin prohormone 1-like n=1 Tax=Poeciliopsis prolifica TaxID=188132 RepID=UPI0024130E86|nr:spexin prohormone 1-like [Poeciliopsis prolifica]
MRLERQKETSIQTLTQATACRTKNSRTASKMSLKVTFLVMSLVSQCCSSPYRRNWTPQAILYLKGAQGHRSTLERSSRDEGEASQLVNFSQINDGLGLSSASIELLQQAAEEGGGGHVYRDSSWKHP